MNGNCIDSVLNLFSELSRRHGLNTRFQLKGKEVAEILPEFINENVTSLSDDSKRLLEKCIENCENPSLDIAMKAKSNYQIAAINLKDGKKGIANFAISRTPVSSAVRDVNASKGADVGESVVETVKDGNLFKFRTSIKEGKALTARGYYDTSKEINPADVYSSHSQRKGKIEVDLETGKAGIHAKTDLAEIENSMMSNLSKEQQEEYLAGKKEFLEDLYKEKMGFPYVDEEINKYFVN